MKHYLQVTDADFEQAIQPVPNQPDTTCKPEQKGAAKSGAVGAHSGEIDADLRAIIDAWPMLSESTKAEILAIVTHSTSVADNGTQWQAKTR